MSTFIIPTAPEDISVDEFFTVFIPDQFKQMSYLLDAVDLSFMMGKEVKVQSDIETQSYSLMLKNGSDLEVHKGPCEKPNITVVMIEKDWRDIVSGKFIKSNEEIPGNPAILITPKRYNALLSTKGTVQMNMKKEDGTFLKSKVIFNGLNRPNVNVDFDLLDVVNLIDGKSTPLSLFMSGKIKFTGDILLLMKLQKFI